MDPENQEIASNEIQETAAETTPAEGTNTQETPAAAEEEDLLSKIAKGQEAAQAAAPAAAAAVPGQAAAAVPGQQAAWAPNFKIKAFKKEYEIPESYRSLVKDAESEKQIRDIFTKYHSFDDTRSMYDSVRKEHNEYVGKYQPIHSQLEKAAEIYGEVTKTGKFHNMDQVFEILGLQPDHVMQYAIERAKLEQMDPAQRDLVQGQINQERQAQTYKEQQQMFESRMQQQEIRLKQQEFSITMTQPQVMEMAEAFQAKFGMDFADEVVAAGESAYASGKNISVAEAIQMVAKRYKLESGQAGGNTQAATATPANQAQTPARVPVKALPNIKANNGSSPVGKPKVTDLDDLKKLRDQAFTS